MQKKAFLQTVALVAVSVVVLLSCTDSGAAGQRGLGQITVGTGENPVLLTYMAERFNKERNPDIKIEIVYTGEWMGNENMAKLVAAGRMPDIIYVENPQFPLQNGWLVDMNQFAAKEESIDIPDAFLRYGTVGDMLIMLPYQVFLGGIMVNLSLLDAENIPRPDYNWTIDDFVNIVRSGTRPGRIIGINRSDFLLAHLPAQLNNDLGWGSFNSTTRQFQLRPEWLQAANIAAGIARSNLTLFDQLDRYGNQWDFEEGSDRRVAIEDERRAAMWEIVGGGLNEDWQPWVAGRAATWWDFSWGMNFDVKNKDIYTGFEWDFFPLPTGDRNTVSRPAIVMDSIGITTAAADPEAAWEFVKWLTYDIDGINARFDFVENWNREEALKRWPGWPESQYPEVFEFTQIPPTTHPEVVERWVELNNARPGLRFIISNMDTGYIDGFKVVPGFSAYNGPEPTTIEKTWLNQVRTGQRTSADIVDEVETIANRNIAEVFASLGL